MTLTAPAALLRYLSPTLLLVMSSSYAADVNTAFHFSVTKATDSAICSAYLARLNSVDYGELGDEGAPFCNRPEITSVSGFSKLNRVPLSQSEQRALILEVWNFTIPALAGPRAALLIDDIPNPNPVWTYELPLDIENNGRPDRILVWRGWGAQAQTGACGHPSDGGLTVRSVQQAYVLDSHDNTIDQATTIAIFGRNGVNQLFENDHPVSTQVFRPIGRSISIFEYRGTFYFDGFLYGPSSDAAQRGNPAIEDRLGLFVHEAGITRQLCEYRMKDPEFARREHSFRQFMQIHSHH